VTIRQVLDRKISWYLRVLGALVATALFVGLVWSQGIPQSGGDSIYSLYSTWAVAHGQFACAYPPKVFHGVPANFQPTTYIAPFYPLLSGALGALARIGHSVAFPGAVQMGPHCTHALAAMYRWSAASGALAPTLLLGYVFWPIVVIGAVALLGVSARRGTLWEPAMLIVLALSTSMLSALTQYFHPQDALAVGLAWCSVALAMRGRWLGAGVVMALAIGSNQFAVLAGVALLAALPRDAWRRYAVASAVTFAALAAPFIIASGGRSWLLVLDGSGFNYSVGGTILWEMQLPSFFMFAASRALPIAVAGLLALWVRRRLGVVSGATMVSLVGVCLSLRLVFEANLWGYYLIPLATTLVVLDAMRGTGRGGVLAWLILTALVFNPHGYGVTPHAISWARWLSADGPVVAAIIGGGMLLVGALRRRVLWHWLVLFIAVSVDRLLGPFVRGAGITWWPTWLVQILLVGGGLILVSAPLAQALRAPRSAPLASLSPMGREVA
jgi:hypothetical protein